MSSYRHILAVIALLAAACGSNNNQSDPADASAGSGGGAGGAIIGGAGGGGASGGTITGGTGGGDAGRDAALLKEPDGALSCDNCSADLSDARSLECYCRSHACPGTLAEALKVGASVRLYSVPVPWLYEERGCGLVVITYRYGAGDGVNLVFDAATEKLVGGSTWSDVGSPGCLKPADNQFSGAQGGVYVDGYAGLGFGYPQAQCPGATTCRLPITDAGGLAAWYDPAMQPCADAGVPDGGDAGRDAALLKEPDGALSCDNCSRDLGEARSLECYCQTHACPGTLAEALRDGARTALQGANRPWMNEERGCGLVVIAYEYWISSGVNLVFDAATEKLIGASTWSDVGSVGCDRPGLSPYGTGLGGVAVDGVLGLGQAYPDPANAQCPGASKCALSDGDAGGEDFNHGLQACTDAGPRDGSASPD